MFEYKRKSSLHFLSIDVIHLAFEPFYWSMKEGVTYHCLQGEFIYCGLLVDGQVLLREKELDELLPLLDLRVLKVEGTSMYVRAGEARQALSLNVEHVSTENIEDDSEEDEEMIFLPRKKRNSIFSNSEEDDTAQQVVAHLREHSGLGFA